MANQLSDFFRSRLPESGTSAQMIDWRAKRDHWLQAVDGLYAFVQEMLRDSIESKVISVRRYETSATEEFIGAYQVPILEITAGKERVEFRPKGVTVIGASGRVDIHGERDAVTLLQEPESVDHQWSVVLQRVPKLKIVPLDQESLEIALERVMLPLS